MQKNTSLTKTAPVYCKREMTQPSNYKIIYSLYRDENFACRSPNKRTLSTPVMATPSALTTTQPNQSQNFLVNNLLLNILITYSCWNNAGIRLVILRVQMKILDAVLRISELFQCQ